ncbi:MAG: hypothetical protein ABIG42_04425 [bacterium]
MPLDPKDIEFREYFDSKKLNEARLKISVLNFLLVVYVFAAIMMVFYRISIADEFKSLLLTFLSIMVPFYIVRSYPNVNLPASGLHREQKIPLRLNLIGALILMLFCNVIFLARFGWIESLIFSLILVYVLAITLGIQPVFAKKTSSAINWTQDEMTWKAGLITLLVFLLRYLWVQVPESAFLWVQNDANTVRLLLSVAALVPFYIGISAARLPVSDVRTTHVYSKAELERFLE